MKTTIELTVPLHAELGLTRNDLDNLAIEASALQHSGARALMLELLERHETADEIEEDHDTVEQANKELEAMREEARTTLAGEAEKLEDAECDFRKCLAVLTDALSEDKRFERVVEILELDYEKLQGKIDAACEAIRNAEGAL